MVGRLEWILVQQWMEKMAGDIESLPFPFLSFRSQRLAHFPRQSCWRLGHCATRNAVATTSHYHNTSASLLAAARPACQRPRRVLQSTKESSTHSTEFRPAFGQPHPSHSLILHRHRHLFPLSTPPSPRFTTPNSRLHRPQRIRLAPKLGFDDHACDEQRIPPSNRTSRPPAYRYTPHRISIGASLVCEIRLRGRNTRGW